MQPTVPNLGLTPGQLAGLAGRIHLAAFPMRRGISKKLEVEK